MRPSRKLGPAAAAVIAAFVAATNCALLPCTSSALPPATQVVNVVAVAANGQPINGYRLLSSSGDPGNVPEVSGCEGSPAAVANDIYACSPSAAAADLCWPSTSGTLLCVDDPWSKELHRLASSDPLPRVRPTPTPQPFALLLDGGTRCRLRNGGAWGGRDDGLVGAYGCLDGALTVLEPGEQTPGESAIDRSRPAWTVKVGDLGAGDPHLPPPLTRTVITAWFAST
jgi:hypothetical protein